MSEIKLTEKIIYLNEIRELRQELKEIGEIIKEIKRSKERRDILYKKLGI